MTDPQEPGQDHLLDETQLRDRLALYNGTVALRETQFLCTGAFLYVPFIFLLISNKFCDLCLLHWPLFRDVGGGGAVH